MKKQLVKDKLKKIKELYRIQYKKDRVNIHTPSFLSIPYDEILGIDKRTSAVSIKTDLFVLSLWKKNKIMHQTIFWNKGKKSKQALKKVL